jgi:hypothetical protein
MLLAAAPGSSMCRVDLLIDETERRRINGPLGREAAPSQG